MWIRIDGKVQMPRMRAPDTMMLPEVVLCERIPAVLQIPLTSLDSTIWLVDSIIVPPGVVLDIASGDTLRGNHLVTARVQPNTLGNYSVTIGIRISPCDTLINVVLLGKALDAALTHADTLEFTQPVIGRKQIMTALYVNTGDIPIDILSVELPAPLPFAFVSSRPLIPCTLLPGEKLECDVEITQRYGNHADSLVLITSNPCRNRDAVALLSEAYATTTVYMPNVESAIGQTELVPVLLDGRPLIDSILLDSFVVEIAVRTQDIEIQNGTRGTCTWRVSLADSLSVVSITGRWVGGDTLAVIPMRPLLSRSTTTPLEFVQTPGFRWFNQQCDVIYRNGSILLGDICSGRLSRLVSIGQARPVVLWPNPSSDVLNVAIDARIFAGEYTLTISNALGSTVLQQLSKGSMVVDASQWSRGLYSVTVCDDTSTFTQTVIIH